MIIVEREQPSHWYLPDGRPFHTVERADGKGQRPATLRDARKVGALPSVTNILNVVAKPGLDAWKIEQGILAALTLPRIDGETADAFAKRVAKDAGEQVVKAQDLGTSLHAAIEAFVSRGEAPIPDLMPYLAPFMVWWVEHAGKVDAVEQTVVSAEEGYAGRLDCVADIDGLPTVVDFKTQRCPDGKPAFYDQWPLQLEAYRRAYRGFVEPVAIASIVIPTTEGRAGCHAKVWPSEDREAYWSAFCAARTLWSYTKGHDPRQKGAA